MTTNRIGATATGDFPAMVDTRPHQAAHGRVDPGPSSSRAPGSKPSGARADSGDPAAAGLRPADPGEHHTAVTAARKSDRPRSRPAPWMPVVPGQHGAWAFLVVPVLFGFAVAGASAGGWLLLGAWLCAYPVGYYGGRALTARVRRGAWTVRGRRERARALPWLVLTAALGLPLAVDRPWLLIVAGLLAAAWGLGLWVAARWGERSLANDLMLVGQATVAVPLTVSVVAGPAALAADLAAPTMQATVVVAAYLCGSVLHVKSLLRAAGNRAYRRADLAWHLCLFGGTALAGAWWLLGTAPALGRALILRPGLRPAAIGGIETVVAAAMVVAAFLAL